VCSPYLGPKEEVAGFWEDQLGGNPLRQRLAPPQVAAGTANVIIIVIIVIVTGSLVSAVGGRVDGKGQRDVGRARCHLHIVQTASVSVGFINHHGCEDGGGWGTICTLRPPSPLPAASARPCTASLVTVSSPATASSSSAAAAAAGAAPPVVVAAEGEAGERPWLERGDG